MHLELLSADLHPIEGLFLGAGKAGVVVGVAALILIGLLLWMAQAGRRLNALETRLEAAEQRPARANASTPITPKRS